MANRAGIIPYFIDHKTKEIKMLFMIPSDPKFGGTRPGIAKGGIDKGETPLQGGIREGEEELGLKKSNFEDAPYHVVDEKITGYTSTYTLHVFAVKIKSANDFNEPHFETGETVWCTPEEYEKVGRGTHKSIVRKVVDAIIAKEF